MHTSLQSFWECFCRVFIIRCFLFRCRRQSAPNEHLQIPQKVCFKTALSKESFNSVRWLPTSQGTFSENFCLDLYEKSRFQRIPQSVTYIHKQILQNECFNTALSKHRFNSVSWVRTSQRICSECFCPVFKWRYFLLHRRLLSAPNEHLQILQNDCFKTALSEVEFQSVMWIHTSQSSFWESFCLVPMGRYFHLHHRRQMSPISFSTVGFKALQMNTCRFYRKTVSKVFYWK